MRNQDFRLKIDKIQLKNFRGLDDIEIAFDERLTILIGDNGSGKTTILDAIAGCLRYLVHQIRKLPLEEPFSKSDISIGMDDLDIALHFKDRLEPFTLTANYTKNKSTTGYNSEGIVEDRISEDETQFWTLERYLTELYEQEDRNLPVIAYYPARYAALTSDKAVSDDILYRFTTYEHALDKEVMNFRTLKKWLVNQSNLEIYGENEDDIRIVQTIKEALVGKKGILNDEDNQRFTDFRVSFKGTNGADGNFLFTKQDKKIYDYQLSSGERMLMLLVADLARRVALANPFSKMPLEEATGIVLLDEIDLHLHPHWQRKVLLKLMRLFSNIQFVIVTHSPFVIASTHPKNIRILVEDTVNHKKICLNAQHEAKHTKGLEPNRILKEIMGAPLRDFETQEKMNRLNNLLKTDYNSPLANQLLAELTDDLGKSDPFIMRVQQETLMLRRKKTI
ncbi:MAG: hypothetical protein RIS64_2261 [Bacteroidota bacterium]|jgi:predicted ATP-binding protein involved in virulence